MLGRKKKKKIIEKGPWRLFNYSKPGEVDIISDDFTHDAILRIDGDFFDLEEKKAYALEIAKRLNAYKE